MGTVPIGPLVRFAIIVATGVYSNWDTISGQFDRTVVDNTKPRLGYYCQHIFQMKDGSGNFSDKERGLFGVHYLNTTGGDLDVTWVTADYAAVESAIQTYWTALSPWMTGDVKLVEHRWYPFGPGVLPPNPPSRIQAAAAGLVGTGTGLEPHQIGETCTFRTPLRRHWGRIYLPLMKCVGDNGGQIGSSLVDAVANGMRTAVGSMNTAQGIVPCVYDRSRHSALGITAYEADSIPDVIRRRRPRTANYKKIVIV